MLKQLISNLFVFNLGNIILFNTLILFIIYGYIYFNYYLNLNYCTPAYFKRRPHFYQDFITNNKLHNIKKNVIIKKQLKLLIIFFFTFFISVFSYVIWLLFCYQNLNFINYNSNFYYNNYFFHIFKIWFKFVLFYVQIDNINFFLIQLTNLIIILNFWYIYNYIVINYFKYFLNLFIIYCSLILTFLTNDIVFFYIFFESVLIPMFILIGFWGSRERRIKANFYLFLYTIFGSLFMLGGIMYLLLTFNSTHFNLFYYCTLNINVQLYLWICFFLPFAIKTPILPFHIWLPEAHVEAPTVGSVILASLLLKLGSYGFIRFLLTMFTYANIYYSPVVYVMSLLSIIYGSLIAIRQIDLKKIIAYSSIAHMNIVVLGLFSLTLNGFNGAFYLMLAHGFVSSGLFFIIGMLYEKTHTRVINYYGGLNLILPVWVFFFFNFSIANMGFPGTANFIGELLIILGIWEKNSVITLLLATCVIFSAVYSIWLFNRVCFGTFKTIFFYKDCFWNLKLAYFDIFILFFLTFFLWFFGLTSDFVLSIQWNLLLTTLILV